MLERVKIVGEPVLSRVYRTASASYDIGQTLYDTDKAGVQIQVSTFARPAQFHRGDYVITTSVELPGHIAGSVSVMNSVVHGKASVDEEVRKLHERAKKLPSVIQLKVSQLLTRQARATP